jgi:nucleotide-binding universal stress UspA family protein
LLNAVERSTKGHEEMNGSSRKILVATDGASDSVLAALSAVKLALAFGSELHVVHVVPVSPPYFMVGLEDVEGPSLYEEDTQRARNLLDEQVWRIEEAGGKVTATHLRMGEPDSEVVSLGEEIGADLIVVGARGLNPLKRLPIGSVSSSIVTHAHCPVLVVREEEQTHLDLQDIREQERTSR